MMWETAIFAPWALAIGGYLLGFWDIQTSVFVYAGGRIILDLAQVCWLNSLDTQVQTMDAKQKHMEGRLARREAPEA